MCGIVGLLVKKHEHREKLGEWMTPMFTCMAARGSDSGGMAIFGESLGQRERRFSLFARDRGYDWEDLKASLLRRLDGNSRETARMDTRANHAVLVSSIEPATLRSWLKDTAPSLHVLSVGQVIDLYKDMGDPKEIGAAVLYPGPVVEHWRDIEVQERIPLAEIAI